MNNQQPGSTDELNGGMHASIFVKVWGDAGGGDAGRIALADYAYKLGQRDARAARGTAPADYVMMPKRLTAENGAKSELIGEFVESITLTCHECNGVGEVDDGYKCIECDGEGTVEQRVAVEWDTIKRIYDRAVALLALQLAIVRAEPAGGQLSPGEPTDEVRTACDHDWPEKDEQTDIDGTCTKCGLSFHRYIHGDSIATESQRESRSGIAAAAPLDLTTTLQEREGFEAQMRIEGVVDFTRRPNGRYENMVLEWHWLGWRGRARAGDPV